MSEKGADVIKPKTIQHRDKYLFAKNRILAPVIFPDQNKFTSWSKVTRVAYISNTKGIVANSVSHKESISG